MSAMTRPVIDVAKVDLRALALYLKGVKIKLDSKADAVELVKAYVNHASDRLKAGEEGYECDNCGTVIAGAEPSCPVCGSATGIDVADQNAPSGLSVRDLDKSVARIREAAVSASRGYWQLGKELLAVYQTRLYRTRVDPETRKPSYRSFKEFCEKELPFRHTVVRQLMTIASVLDRETVEQVGNVSKLELIAKIPEQHRAEVLKRFEALPNRSEMAKEVQRLFPAARSPRISPNDSSTRRPSRARSEAKAAASSEKDRVTAVVQPGVVEITLKKSRTPGVLVGKEPAINGLVVEYEFKPKTSALRITRRRV